MAKFKPLNHKKVIKIKKNLLINCLEYIEDLNPSKKERIEECSRNTACTLQFSRISARAHLVFCFGWIEDNTEFATLVLSKYNKSLLVGQNEKSISNDLSQLQKHQAVSINSFFLIIIWNFRIWKINHYHQGRSQDLELGGQKYKQNFFFLKL